MKETDFLEVINKTLSDSHFIGDDCAYVQDLGIFVTQDSLVEDVHFSLNTTNPYNLGRKSIAVNLSDLAASLSTPKYVSISISLPNSIKNEFIEDFYKGVNDICNEYGVKVIGGDITGSDKIFISVTAIGKQASQHITSRKFAKEGDLVVSTGVHGSSSCALYAIQNNITVSEDLLRKHINPQPKNNESIELSKTIQGNIALMDTSDGLADALYKLSAASNVSMDINFDKINVSSEIVEIAKENNLNYSDWVLWGGEDYELIACVPEETYNKLDKNIFNIIGKVQAKSNEYLVNIKMPDNDLKITKDIFENKSFNHFMREE